MNPREKFMLICHEVTEFCLARATATCFGGWSREQVFLRIAGAAIGGYLFVVRDGCGVRAMGIAKPTTKGLFIWEVIGKRSDCARMMREARQRWPDFWRYFAYRRGKCIEIRASRIEAFCERSAV